MPKLYILRGIPASGKTTKALKIQKEYPNTKRVNRDELRKTILGDAPYNKKNEELIKTIRDSIISSSLKNGFDVISDDTNMDSATVNHLHKIAKKITNVTVYEKYLNVTVEEAIKRDSNRKKTLGEEVVKKFYDKFAKNINIVSETYYPSNTLSTKKNEQNENLPKAIICDLDGTLTKMNGKRGPFDWDKVDLDEINKPVKFILDLIKEKNHQQTERIEIIFLSGRDERAEKKTKKWLLSVGFLTKGTASDEFKERGYKLYMRSEGDSRKDSIIKKELYEKYIKNKYNVLFVLDDRNQVVDLWRKEIGIPCFQVDYGDF